MLQLKFFYGLPDTVTSEKIHQALSEKAE